MCKIFHHKLFVENEIKQTSFKFNSTSDFQITREDFCIFLLLYPNLQFLMNQCLWKFAANEETTIELCIERKTDTLTVCTVDFTHFYLERKSSSHTFYDIGCKNIMCQEFHFAVLLDARHAFLKGR